MTALRFRRYIQNALVLPIHQDAGLNSYLNRGLLATFLITVCGKAAVFLTGIVLARLLGPANLGIYAVALAVAQLLRLSTVFGLPGMVVRYVSLYDAQHSWGLLRGLLQRGLRLTVILSLVAVVIGSLVIWAARGALGLEKTLAFLAALWMVPLLDFAVLRSAVLQGFRHVTLAQIPDGLIRPLVFLVALVLFWDLGDASVGSPVTVLALQWAVVLVTFVIGLPLLYRAVPRSVWNAAAEYDACRWRGSFVPFMFLYAIQLLLSHADVLMLSALSTDLSVGLYRVASQGGELMAFTLGIVNLVIQPVISRLHTSGDRERLQDLITRTVRLSTIIAVPIALSLLMFGERLLAGLFGPEYQASYLPMMILVSGQMVNVACGSVGLLLFMTGHERDAAWSIASALTINIALGLALIPVFGAEGAAVASAVSLIAWNIFLYRRVRRRLAIHPTIFGRRL